MDPVQRWWASGKKRLGSVGLGFALACMALVLVAGPGCQWLSPSASTQVTISDFTADSPNVTTGTAVTLRWTAATVDASAGECRMSTTPVGVADWTGLPLSSTRVVTPSVVTTFNLSCWSHKHPDQPARSNLTITVK